MINTLNGNTDIVNEDSNSNSNSEKPSVDTGQTDSNSSKADQINNTNPPTDVDESSLSNDRPEVNAPKIKLGKLSKSNTNVEGDEEEEDQEEDETEDDEEENGEEVVKTVPALKIKPIPELKRIGSVDVIRVIVVKFNKCDMIK